MSVLSLTSDPTVQSTFTSVVPVSLLPITTVLLDVVIVVKASLPES